MSHLTFTSRMSENRIWQWLLLACLPMFCLGLGAYGLLDPDEGRYASIPQQMLFFNDFVTPRQNWVKFFDKPPLLYWSIAASYSVFGVHEWSARLVPTLAALGGLLSPYVLGRRMFGIRTGLMGATILATSLIWPILARFVVTDMLVSALVFGALTFWWLGHTESNLQRQNSYFVGFWVTVAFATLAKGPIAVVLCGGCIVLYALVCQQWQAVRRMRWSWGIPLFIGIAAPWFIIVAMRNPEFNHFFWVDQHIGRFMGQTSGNDHRESFWYYFQMLPLMVFPWSVFIPTALITGLKLLHSSRHKPLSQKRRAVIYLMCGICFTLVLFSASSGKIITYILPVVPLLALLLAAYFDWLLVKQQEQSRGISITVGVLATFLILAGGAVAVLTPRHFEPLGIGFLFLVWAIVLLLCSRRFGIRGTVASTAAGFVVTLLSLLPAFVVAMPHFTLEPLTDHIRPGLRSHLQSSVFTVGYIRSVPFYTEQRIGILGIPDELKMGVDQMPFDEKHQWFFNGATDIAHLRKKMLHPYPVYVFIRNPRRQSAKAQKIIREFSNGATIIMANEKFVVFGNSAALEITPPKLRLQLELLNGRKLYGRRRLKAGPRY